MIDKTQTLRSRCGIYLFLVVITLGIYAQTYHFEFVGIDDAEYVTENPHVLSPFTPESIRWALTTGYFNNWHPLTWFSHMLDVQLFGMNAGGHHLVNVLFHILNTLLLFEAFRRMTGALWRSALVAALFAVHPLHVESVAWVAERKDVLSAFFGFLALLWYGAYAKRPSIIKYLLVMLSFALALTAKSMLVTLPCVFLLMDYWPLGRFGIAIGHIGPMGPIGPIGPQAIAIRDHRWVLIEKLPLFALSLMASAVAWLVRTPPNVPVEGRVANALVVHLQYLWKTIWPSGLAVFYPHPGNTLPLWQAAGAALVLLGVSAMALRWLRRAPYFAVGWFWYLGTLAPVNGLVQIGRHGMADRYTYLPLVGLFIAAAWALPDLTDTTDRTDPTDRTNGRTWRRAALAAIGCVLLALTVTAGVQVRYWRDSVTLFTHALAVTRDNTLAHNNLGAVLLKMGRTDEALGHFAEALRIDPAYASAHTNLGKFMADQGRLDEAIAHYMKAIESEPENEKTHNNLGLALAERGRYEEAVVCFENALRLAPNYVNARLNLGNLLAGMGRWDEAQRQYLDTIRIYPVCRDAYFDLGGLFAKQGKFVEAESQYRQALEIDPGFTKAYENLGAVMEALGRTREAVEFYGKALDIDPADNEARARLDRLQTLPETRK